MNIVWATRGRTWGFRFLRDGGFQDPLPEYERAFESASGEPEAFERSGDRVALRFPDPLAREDQAGRVIPHEFVVFDPEAGLISSVAEGRALVWPEVSEQFEHDWRLPEPHISQD